MGLVCESPESYEPAGGNLAVSYTHLYTKYLISLVLIFVGTQCHSSAYIAFLIIPIYLWSHVYNGKWWLMLAIICNILYIGKIFIDISALQVYMTMFSDQVMLDNVEGYIEQIGTEFNNCLLYTSEYYL